MSSLSRFVFAPLMSFLYWAICACISSRQARRDVSVTATLAGADALLASGRALAGTATASATAAAAEEEGEGAGGLFASSLSRSAMSVALIPPQNCAKERA